MTARKVIYVACPYTHDDPVVKQIRYEVATKVAAYFVKQGHIVYSPITHTHPLDVEIAGTGTLGSDYWVDFDETFMGVCTEMVIITLAGWSESSGIKREHKFFHESMCRISYFDPYEEGFATRE